MTYGIKHATAKLAKIIKQYYGHEKKPSLVQHNIVIKNIVMVIPSYR